MQKISTMKWWMLCVHNSNLLPEFHILTKLWKQPIKILKDSTTRRGIDMRSHHLCFMPTRHLSVLRLIIWYGSSITHWGTIPSLRILMELSLKELSGPLPIWLVEFHEKAHGLLSWSILSEAYGSSLWQYGQA